MAADGWPQGMDGTYSNFGVGLGMVENACRDAICSVAVAIVADCARSASARTEEAEKSAARRQEIAAVLILKVAGCTSESGCGREYIDSMSQYIYRLSRY